MMKCGKFENLSPLILKIEVGVVWLAGLPTMRSTPVSSQKRSDPEKSENSAQGRGSRVVRTPQKQLANFEYSTENRPFLVLAFEMGQNQGLGESPSRMHAAGEISYMSGPTHKSGRFCA